MKFSKINHFKYRLLTGDCVKVNWNLEPFVFSNGICKVNMQTILCCMTKKD